MEIRLTGWKGYAAIVFFVGGLLIHIGMEHQEMVDLAADVKMIKAVLIYHLPPISSVPDRDATQTDVAKRNGQ